MFESDRALDITAPTHHMLSRVHRRENLPGAITWLQRAVQRNSHVRAPNVAEY
jgi:hypothetical protein